MALTRKKPLLRHPRGKGGRGEREVIALLKEHGWTRAYRSQSSGAFGGGDITNAPPGTSFEVKFCETTRPWEWIAQCEAGASPTDIPVVAFRRSRSDWHAIIPLVDLLDLLKRAEMA